MPKRVANLPFYKGKSQKRVLKWTSQFLCKAHQNKAFDHHNTAHLPLGRYAVANVGQIYRKGALLTRISMVKRQIFITSKKTDLISAKISKVDLQNTCEAGAQKLRTTNPTEVMR